MIKNPTILKTELISEIILAFPSREIISQPSMGVVEYKGKRFVIKSKFNELETKKALENPDLFIKVNTRNTDMYHLYSELSSKFVLFNYRILNARALEPLEKLLEMGEYHD